MKKRFFTLKISLCLAAVLAGTGMVFADDVIVVPEKMSPTLTFAVEDLTRCLTKVTGRQFRIATKCDPDTSALLVGGTPQEVSELAPDEWLLRREGQNYRIAGGGEGATTFGIYDFLERFAGCLWLDLDTEVIPYNPDFSFPEGEIRVRPAILAREIYTGMDRGSRADGELKLRNMENLPNSHFPEASVEFGSPRPNHTLEYYAKAQGWSDDSYFALDASGKRNHVHYCLSNPEVRNSVARQLRIWIEADRAAGSHPRYYDISQNDTGNGQECVCPRCSAIMAREGAYSGVLGEFLNAVSAQIRDEYPDVILTTLAYNFTADPPAHLRFADNIAVRICGISAWAPFTKDHWDKRMEGWKNLTSRTGIWDYAKHFVGLEFPYMYRLDELADAVRNCRDYHTELYFFEYENPLERSFAQLQWWMFLRMTVNPDRNFDELVDKFMVGYYGAAAPAMRKYFNYLLERQREQYTGSSKEEVARYTPYLDRAFFDKVNPILDEAETLAADNPLHARHVRRERIPVDCAFLTLIKVLPEERDTRRAIFTRYATNTIETADACPRLAEWQKINTRKMLEVRSKLENVMPLDIPEQFANCDLVDIVWNDFTPYGNHSDFLYDDEKAVGGCAWGLSHRESGEVKCEFGYPVTFQLSDFDGSDYARRAVTAEELPADNEFHWLEVGEMFPHPKGIITANGLGMIVLHKGVVGIVPAKQTIWVHAKVAGAPFGGSESDKPGVFVDRIIAVRHGEVPQNAPGKLPKK